MPYPLFAGAHVAMLGKHGEIELPQPWREAFRAEGPGIIGPCLGEPDAWNLYRSIDSSAFHRDVGHPWCLLELSARGTFRLTRELRRREHRPGTRLLFIGQGMWVQLWVASAFFARIKTGGPDAEAAILERLSL